MNLDTLNANILAARQAKLDDATSPVCGDYVVFADGVTRRISHVWDDGVQTSDAGRGSWYLGDGYVSFSGSLYHLVRTETLTRTDEQRAGRCWFFKDNWMEAHNGIDVVARFRVYSCSVAAPRY